jgi:cytoskeletal protein CcmA (bactofilin family)
MFLRHYRRKAVRDESGSTLIGVVGLVAIAGILTAVIASTTVSALSFTSSTRAGVQAEAAADAGVEFARALIDADECVPSIDRNYGQVYSAGELADLGVASNDPFFEATVQYKIALTGTWTTGCPNGLLNSLLNYQVRIESTGFAQSKGVGGANGHDQHTVEAVFDWNVITPTEEQQPDTSIKPTGPAVYAYSSSGFGGGGTLYSVDGTGPDVMVKTGNVTCDGGSEGVSDLIVDGGNLVVKGGCDLDGNAWSSGRTTVDGGATVGGNVVAAGITHKGTSIGGSVWSTSDVTLSGGGTIGGTATAASLSVTNGKLMGAGWVYGASTFDWGGDIYSNITTKSHTKPNRWDGQHNGAVITNVPAGPGASPYPTPVRPFVPNWVNFTFDASEWTGFTVTTMLVTCTYAQLQAAINSFAGAPGIIDARLCLTGIVINGSQKVQLPGDVAIIANKFSLTNGGGFRASDDTRLWLITPDGLALDTAPSCIGSSFTMSGDFDFSESISTMLYTPCKVAIGTGIDTFRGQLFVGAADIDGGASIGYTAVGLPGVDLNTGEHTDSGGEIIVIELPSIGSLGDLDYYRDIPEPTVD